MGERRGVLLLLALVLALDLTGLGWGLPHTLAPHPDDVAKPTLEALQQRFLEPTKYPKVQMIVVATAYAPYLALLWWRGELRSGADATAASGELLDDPVPVLSNLLYLARLTEVVAHLLATLLVYHVARRLAGEVRAALFAAALFALAPWTVFFTKTSTVDVPMTFWLAACMAVAARLWETPGRRGLLAFAVLGVLAVCTKDQAAFYLAPVGAALGARCVARLGAGPAARAALPALLAALLLWAALNDLLWAPANFTERWGAWGADLSGWRDHVAGAPGVASLVRETVDYSVSAVGVGLALAGVWAAWVCLRARDLPGLLLAGHLLLYPLLLVGYLGFVQPRYMIPQSLTLALLGARAWGLRRSSAAPPARVAAAVGLVAFALVQAGLLAWSFTSEPRGAATRWLTANVAPGTEVESYQKPNSLPGVRAAGLKLRRVHDVTLAGFEARRPALACVVGNERWNWNADELAFAERLLLGDVAALGYRRTHFGRRDPQDTRWYLPHDLRSRLHPEVVILQRIETP